MSHARQQIRAAAIVDLTGLTTTGSRCYAGRVYNLETLPALKIFTGKETSQFHARDGTGRIYLRMLDLVIEGHAQAAGDALDDSLDAIAAEVETALEAGSLMALVEDLALSQTEVEMTAGAEKPTGIVRLTYVVAYRTREAAPETLVG